MGDLFHLYFVKIELLLHSDAVTEIVLKTLLVGTCSEMSALVARQKIFFIGRNRQICITLLQPLYALIVYLLSLIF